MGCDVDWRDDSRMFSLAFLQLAPCDRKTSLEVHLYQIPSSGRIPQIIWPPPSDPHSLERRFSDLLLIPSNPRPEFLFPSESALQLIPDSLR
jgi:hypothetical protein